MNSVLKNEPNFFFISGHGATGKTFLWNTVVTYLRAQRRIVLTVASSGVASLLLPNGRTAHSRFRIPIDIDELSVCDIKRGTKLAELLTQTALIIWDEALMTNRQCFEALDRSLRDILSEKRYKSIGYTIWWQSCCTWRRPQTDITSYRKWIEITNHKCLNI